MIGSKDIAQTLLFSNKQKEIDTKTLVSNTLAYLKKQKSLHLLPEILRILERESALEEKTNSINITTSHEISKEALSKIKEKLFIDSKEVPNQVVDHSLLGGFIAEHQGVIYDASIKRRLELLKKHLTK